MPKQWYPDPDARQAVIDWPPGTSLVRYAHYRNSSGLNALPEALQGRYRLMQRLKDGGWVTWDQARECYTRTNKVMPPRRIVQRRTVRTPRPYNGPWPWSVDAHWKRMHGSGFRLQHNVVRQLQGRIPDIRERYRVNPVIVHSKTQLARFRTALLAVFAGTPPDVWAPEEVLLFTSPHLLHLVLCDLGVTPVWCADGSWGDAFEPLDENRAMASIEAFMGTGSILDRYRAVYG